MTEKLYRIGRHWARVMQGNPPVTGPWTVQFSDQMHSESYGTYHDACERALASVKAKCNVDFLEAYWNRKQAEALEI